MAQTPSNIQDVLPLTPTVFHILLALVENERHGYGIIQAVEQHTDGRLRMAPGTLYGAINRLLASGWIAESDERPDPDLDDQRRRYYRLTTLGRHIAEAEAERLAALVQTARAKHLLPEIGSA